MILKKNVLRTIFCFLLFSLMLGCEKKKDISELKPLFLATNVRKNYVTLIDPKEPYSSFRIDVEKLVNAKNTRDVAYGNDFFATANLRTHNATMINLNDPRNPVEVKLANAKSPYAIAYGNKFFAIANIHSNNVSLIDSNNPKTSIEVKFTNAKGPTDIVFGSKFFATACGYLKDIIVFIDPKSPQTPIEVNIGELVGSSSSRSIAFGSGFFAVCCSKSVVLLKEDNLQKPIRVILSKEEKVRDIVFGNGLFAVIGVEDNVLRFIDPNAPTKIKEIRGSNASSEIASGKGFFAIYREYGRSVTLVNAKNFKSTEIKIAKFGAKLVGGMAFNNGLLAIVLDDEVVFIDPKTSKKVASAKVEASSIYAK
ncbi:hypothetical protein [Candidatus Uabimicrobium sp. HlEnr_7]|uniref:hypothetical protein n=1 Tax=Candidatus Uabimicrobium helgolandensis TaxID=3095367 RepID=UPI00355890B6